MRVDSRLITIPALTAIVGMAMVAGASGARAQQPAGGGLLAEAVKLKLESIKQAAAANRAALSQYTWTESVQVSLNGEVKTTKQMSCRNGVDGKPQCTPVGSPPAQEQPRGLIGKIKAEKKEEYADYIRQVKALISTYVPPDAAKMQAAHEAGNVSLSQPGAGAAGLMFKNYSLPGDSMTLDFSMATHKLTALAVNSYLGDASSGVTLAVQFATLADGTNYPAQETINAAAKGIQLLITNSNYQKLTP